MTGVAHLAWARIPKNRTFFNSSRLKDRSHRRGSRIRTHLQVGRKVAGHLILFSPFVNGRVQNDDWIKVAMSFRAAGETIGKCNFYRWELAVVLSTFLNRFKAKQGTFALLSTPALRIAQLKQCVFDR